jgi:hypothetical protein
MRISAVSLALVTLVACGDRKVPPIQTIDMQNAPDSAAGRYSIFDFRNLRFLEGRWRGSMPDGKPFFEEYRFLDDTTILRRGFPDSTFAKASDSSRVQLRDSTVSNEGGTARWAATRLDSLGADFSPSYGASNTFTWAKESPTRWIATLRFTNKEGRPETVTYPMVKVP